MKKGTLIRVNSRALAVDRIDKDDCLWVIVEERLPAIVDGAGAFRCKSLATGERWTWFTDEFDIEEE